MEGRGAGGRVFVIYLFIFPHDWFVFLVGKFIWHKNYAPKVLSSVLCFECLTASFARSLHPKLGLQKKSNNDNNIYIYNKR